MGRRNAQSKLATNSKLLSDTGSLKHNNQPKKLTKFQGAELASRIWLSLI